MEASKHQVRVTSVTARNPSSFAGLRLKRTSLIPASFHLLSDVSVLEAIIANTSGILCFLQKVMLLYASLLALLFSHGLI